MFPSAEVWESGLSAFSAANYQIFCASQGSVPSLVLVWGRLFKVRGWISAKQLTHAL